MYVFFLLNLFKYVASSVAFSSSSMCNNEKITDCSYQISSRSNSCLLYNTEVCNGEFNRPFPFSETVHELKAETSYPFEVSLIPYTAYVSEVHKVNPVSSLNITVDVKHKAISWFSIIMTQAMPAVDRCRMFDIRNSSVKLEYPIHFFYDCFYGLVEKDIKNVLFTFNAYPLNVRLRYFVFLPPVPVFEKKLDAACAWKPLIMILCGSLEMGVIDFKFSRAPESLDALHYLITLLGSSGVVQDSIQASANDSGSMIQKKFSNVRSGSYSVGIRMVTVQQVSCPLTQTVLFYAGKESASTFGLLLFCVILSVAILLLCGLFYLLYFHKTYCKIKKKILLIYSCDSPQHEDMILSLQLYLERESCCRVHSIYKTGQDAFSFILEKFKEADALIFVISKGMTEGEIFSSLHPCQNQLQKAYHIYSSKFHLLGGKKKTCALSFTNLGKQHIPELLKPVTFFCLPKDEQKFANFIFGCLLCKKYFFRSKRLRHFRECIQESSFDEEKVAKSENICHFKGPDSSIAVSAKNKNLTAQEKNLNLQQEDNFELLSPCIEKHLFMHS